MMHWLLVTLVLFYTAVPCSSFLLLRQQAYQVKTYERSPISHVNSHLKLFDTSAGSFKPYIEKLVAGQDLDTSEVESAWAEILSGADPVQVSALLVLLRAKGETPKELAGMVNAMKKACRPVTVPGSPKLLDIVGTGGDGAHTINISTAAIILAAAAGAMACKAGNRSVSSKCGSADVLEKLGIAIEMSPEEVSKCVQASGIGFMYAPINHPAMKAVAPIRKSLGVRTAFNILGPMTNAASASRAVIGVFQSELVPLIGATLMEVGTVDHAIVVHSAGLDELSPMAPATIFEIMKTKTKTEEGGGGYVSRTFNVDPEDLGIKRCVVEDLRGGDADFNAQAMRTVLSGGEHNDACRDAVVLNAGAGLFVYNSEVAAAAAGGGGFDEDLNERGIPKSFVSAVDLARQTLISGAGVAKLDQWIAASQDIASK